MSWALVLSGVGTPALAWHSGLLAALQAGGADLTAPDLIVGTSAGAIVAARIACGRALDAAFARDRDAGAAPPRDIDELSQAVEALRGELAGAESWPERPLQIPALDVGTGALEVWTRSAGVPLADAVASTCAMPFVGSWPTIKGRRFADPGNVSATNADLAFGHRLVIVIAAAGPHGPLDGEVQQLQAGGSHVRLLFPDGPSSEVLVRELLNPGRRAAAAAAGYAQGAAIAPVVRDWLQSRHALRPQVNVDDLAARFAAPSLRRSEWTHVAHLAVGAWHVHRFGASDGLTRVRDGIRRLNVSIGGANTDTSGYHETITAAYVALLAAFLETCPRGWGLNQCLERLWTTPIVERDILLTFYTRERLFSREARARWVDPDLAPLAVDALLERAEPA